MAPTFSGGKLNLKGSKKSKKKNKKSKHKIESENGSKLKSRNDESNNEIHDDNEVDYDEDLTPAERRSLKIKKEREHQELEKIAGKSHRERVEEFNDKLGSLTEHNDIPRVSAAGNG
mmetsp:Transcript_12810/g.14459  ORF Transcript_12810/g.14459 Transcript_12810/m.14459 type:complete len:117 (-) Transcript_12810:190-540(-)